jgi:hypothetical protein
MNIDNFIGIAADKVVRNFPEKSGQHNKVRVKGIKKV